MTDLSCHTHIATSDPDTDERIIDRALKGLVLEVNGTDILCTGSGDTGSPDWFVTIEGLIWDDDAGEETEEKFSARFMGAEILVY